MSMNEKDFMMATRIEKLEAILTEFVLEDDAGYIENIEYGHQECLYCLKEAMAVGKNDRGHNIYNYPHEDDCPITRARQLLATQD